MSERYGQIRREMSLMSRQFERFLLLASLCVGVAMVMAGILYTVPAAAQPAAPRMTEIGSNIVTHTT